MSLYSIIYFNFLIALVATLGSLFFSEVMEFVPCVLCWYQRIAMYPLVILFATSLYIKDKNIFHYAFPFSLMGLFISIYHLLLHYQVISESISPCRNGVPCSTIYINWFGFITIPHLSFLSFLIITISLIIYKRKNTYEKK